MAKYYEFIGKMIGKALYESITIGPKFCGPFLNAIIGKKNNFDDLRKIDK
jgi:ubiquitin-protein ligase E3 C